jgi:hypothetical protein
LARVLGLLTKALMDWTGASGLRRLSRAAIAYMDGRESAIDAQ